MGADGGHGRFVGRARRSGGRAVAPFGGWAAAWTAVWAVALTSAFTGLAWLFMRWDLRTGADSGLSRLQGWPGCTSDSRGSSRSGCSPPRRA